MQYNLNINFMLRRILYILFIFLNIINAESKNLRVLRTANSTSLVHYSGKDDVKNYSIKISELCNSSNGFSIIGVAKKVLNSHVLWCIDKDFIPQSMVGNYKLGYQGKYMFFEEYYKEADSLMIFTYTRNISINNKDLWDSYLKIGKIHSNQYSYVFDTQKSYEEPLLEYYLFNKKLSESKIKIIETAVALTHGITLNQEKPTNYIDSKGNIIWDAEDNINYNHAIAGIGHDIGTDLYLFESSSIQDKEFPLISCKDTINNGMYLIWSHNDSSLNFKTDSLETQSVLERKWKYIKTGDWRNNSFKIKFNTSELECFRHSNENLYYLIIDSISDYSVNNDASHKIKGKWRNADELYFENVNLTSNVGYFTILTEPIPENVDEEPFQYIYIYPSPTIDGNFNIDIALYKENDVEISVYNSVGILVDNRNLVNNDRYNYKGILPTAGIYIVIVKVNDVEKVEKIVCL